MVGEPIGDEGEGSAAAEEDHPAEASHAESQGGLVGSKNDDEGNQGGPERREGGGCPEEKNGDEEENGGKNPRKSGLWRMISSGHNNCQNTANGLIWQGSFGRGGAWRNDKILTDNLGSLSVLTKK